MTDFETIEVREEQHDNEDGSEYSEYEVEYYWTAVSSNTVRARSMEEACIKAAHHNTYFDSVENAYPDMCDIDVVKCISYTDGSTRMTAPAHGGSYDAWVEVEPADISGVTDES